MNRAIQTTLVTSLMCAMTWACGSNSEAPARADAAPLAIESAEPSPASALASAPVMAERISNEPVLASTTAVPVTGTVPVTEVTTTNLRSPSLLPAGTPEEHVAAFINLPLSKRDKPLVGGVGASGIHLDELMVGKGWASSRCQELGARFEVDVDERVNLCFRVVHPRVAETVTVEWARAGKVRQSIAVNVQPTHSYLTRAWLPVGRGRAGLWTATVKSEDGSVLGQIEFEIADTRP